MVCVRLCSNHMWHHGKNSHLFSVKKPWLYCCDEKLQRSACCTPDGNHPPQPSHKANFVEQTKNEYEMTYDTGGRR